MPEQVRKQKRKQAQKQELGLLEIPLHQIQPNPWRNFANYPLKKKKLETLEESFQSTGYWGNLIGRWSSDGKYVELAFGHHRLEVLRQRYGEKSRTPIRVIVRPLSNEVMIKMMADENLGEWSTSVWLEMEAVQAVIRAYGRGEIDLDAVPSQVSPQKMYAVGGNGQCTSQDLTPSDAKRYTLVNVARFLGWLKSDGKVDNKAKTAFACLRLVELGVLTRGQLEDFSRDAAMALCRKLAQVEKLAKRRLCYRKWKRDTHPEVQARAISIVQSAANRLCTELNKSSRLTAQYIASVNVEDLIEAEAGKRQSRKDEPLMDFQDSFNELMRRLGRLLQHKSKQPDRIAKTIYAAHEGDYDLVTPKHWKRMHTSLLVCRKRLEKLIQITEKHVDAKRTGSRK